MKYTQYAQEFIIRLQTYFRMTDDVIVGNILWNYIKIYFIITYFVSGSNAVYN